MALGKDPAESTSLRFYYRDWRPTLLGRVSTRLWAWLTAVGIADRRLTTLLVKERRSESLVAHVLVPITFEGRTYLVSMLGEGSNWVQDVRATEGGAFLKRGRSTPVALTEVPVSERPPILKAWCQVATSGRRHLPVPYDAPVSAFEAIAADYPVFRVDPIRTAESRPHRNRVSLATSLPPVVVDHDRAK
jgi:hypothetical protein